MDWRLSSDRSVPESSAPFAVDVAAPEPVELHEHDAYAWSSLTDKPPVTDAVKDVLAAYRQLRTEALPGIT